MFLLSFTNFICIYQIKVTTECKTYCIIDDRNMNKIGIHQYFPIKKNFRVTLLESLVVYCESSVLYVLKQFEIQLNGYIEPNILFPPVRYQDKNTVRPMNTASANTMNVYRQHLRLLALAAYFSWSL